MWPIYQCHVANIIVTNKYPGNASHELNPDLEPRSTWCQRFPLTVLNNNKRASKLTNMRIREAFQIRQHNSKLLLNYKYVEKLFVKCFEYIVLSIFSTKTEI
ncbi:Protein of unknown function [Gryllus bimaculatus]|nr:Protein of unknown function [Gryllus bimaculatus]